MNRISSSKNLDLQSLKQNGVIFDYKIWKAKVILLQYRWTQVLRLSLFLILLPSIFCLYFLILQGYKMTSRI